MEALLERVVSIRLVHCCKRNTLTQYYEIFYWPLFVIFKW